MDATTRAYLLDETSSSARLDRRPLDDLAEKFSGARLERVWLDDGRRYVLKFLPPGGDWLTRATDGEGRPHLLWSSSLLDAVGAAVDHAVVDCVETGRGWVVIMRDAADQLLPARVPVSRGTSRRLLAGLARLHGVSLVRRVEGLCTLAARYRLFAPEFHRNDSGNGTHPLRDVILKGWEIFHDVVPEDVAAAVAAVHHDPDPLGHALQQFPVSLLHGDAKLENMGLADEKLVLIDWGDLTGFGPAEVDIAWYVLKGAARIGADPGDLFADYEAESGRNLDPDALDLACVGSLAQMGFRMAHSAAYGRPEPQATGSAQLDWWVRRVRPALDSLPY